MGRTAETHSWILRSGLYPRRLQCPPTEDCVFMQTHSEKSVRRHQLMSTRCALKFGLIVEAPLCLEAAVQLPERGSPAALIISFIYRGWSHTPVHIKLIISNKQVNKSHLQKALHRWTCWYTTEYEKIISMQAPAVALMCQCFLITVKKLLTGGLLNFDWLKWPSYTASSFF